MTAASLSWSLSVAHRVKVGVGEPGLGHPTLHVKVAGRREGQRFRPCHEPGDSGVDQRWGEYTYVVSSIESVVIRPFR